MHSKPDETWRSEFQTTAKVKILARWAAFHRIYGVFSVLCIPPLLCLERGNVLPKLIGSTATLSNSRNIAEL